MSADPQAASCWAGRELQAKSLAVVNKKVARSRTAVTSFSNSELMALRTLCPEAGIIAVSSTGRAQLGMAEALGATVAPSKFSCSYALSRSTAERLFFPKRCVSLRYGPRAKEVE